MTRNLEVSHECVKEEGKRGFSFSPRAKGSPSDGDEKLGISQQCSEQSWLYYFFFTSE